MLNQGLVVVVSGCSGSGKTSLAEALAAQFGRSIMLSQDAFYVRDAPSDAWESPSSFDWDALVAEVQRCAAVYRVVVVEGFCVLSDERVAALSDVVVRIECPMELALQRRLARDREAGPNDPANSRHYFETTVWPAHNRYVAATEVRATGAVEVDAASPLPQSVARVAAIVRSKRS